MARSRYNTHNMAGLQKFSQDKGQKLTITTATGQQYQAEPKSFANAQGFQIRSGLTIPYDQIALCEAIDPPTVSNADAVEQGERDNFLWNGMVPSQNLVSNADASEPDTPIPTSDNWQLFAARERSINGASSHTGCESKSKLDELREATRQKIEGAHKR